MPNVRKKFAETWNPGATVLLHQSSASGLKLGIDAVLDCFVILVNFEVSHRSESPFGGVQKTGS